MTLDKGKERVTSRVVPTRQSKLLADLRLSGKVAQVARLLSQAVWNELLEAALAPEQHASGATNVDLQTVGALASLADIGAVFVGLRRLLRLLFRCFDAGQRRFG